MSFRGLKQILFGNAGIGILLTVLLLTAPLLCAQEFGEETPTQLELDRFLNAQSTAVQAHKALAFTTGGLLLAADGIGLWHFLQMMDAGHVIRNRLHFQEEAADLTPQIQGIRTVWQRDSSQTLRIIHASLIAAASMTYSATAAIELSWPNMDQSKFWLSNRRIHKGLFFFHAGLMAANIGLGLAESWALSQGRHELVYGLGVAHIAVGFSLPIVMFSSGLAFSLPSRD